MGRKRITVIGDVMPEKEEKKVKVEEIAPETVVEATAEEPKEEVKKETSKKPAEIKIRGKAYQAAKTKVETGKAYSLTEAIKLLKETSFSKFVGSAEVHLVVNKKGLSGEALLPHYEAKAKVVEIASDETIKKIENNKIDFDILIATPAFMPNLVKFAKVLGPKGLMPNPKTGTITEKPEETLKKLSKASFVYKTEGSAPIIHSVFGKVNQKEEELEANLKALIKAINPKNIISGVVKASMGPAIKIKIE
jgi:large subunit ribosomal protein L1